MPKENPQGREGQKNIDCEHYLGCMTYAARQNYRAFNCESCDLFKVGPKEKIKASEMDGKKLCDKCSQKPVVNQFSKYCSGCLNSFKKAKKKAPGTPKKNKAGTGKAKPRKARKAASAVATEKLCKKCGGNPTIHQNSPYCSGCLHDMKKAKQKAAGTPETNKPELKPEKALKAAGTVATIDFGKYASILKEVVKLADEEMRPLDLQIIYMLKNQLNKEEGKQIEPF